MISNYNLQRSRTFWATVSLLSFSLIAFALYLQYYKGYEPCFLCIVQRIAIIVIGFTALFAVIKPKLRLISYMGWLIGGWAGLLSAGRQIFLQHNPPEMYSCGPGIEFILENNSLVDAIPLLLKPQSDCSTIDITFLTLPLSNWMFISFVISIIFLFYLIFKDLQLNKNK